MQEAEGQLTNLKSALKAIPLMVQITRATELKDLQQHAARALERQQKRCEHLNEFQDIGDQLAVKFVDTLQAV